MIVLSTICCNCWSFKLFPTIIFNTKNSSPFEISPSRSMSYTLKATESEEREGERGIRNLARKRVGAPPQRNRDHEDLVIFCYNLTKIKKRIVSEGILSLRSIRILSSTYHLWGFAPTISCLSIEYSNLLWEVIRPAEWFDRQLHSDFKRHRDPNPSFCNLFLHLYCCFLSACWWPCTQSNRKIVLIQALSFLHRTSSPRLLI